MTYNINHFAIDIKTLNERWGNPTLDPVTMSEDEIWQGLQRQYNITLEEIEEIGAGIETRNHTEVLDGIVDGLFTLVRFISLTKKMYDVEGAMKAVVDNNKLKCSETVDYFTQLGYKSEYTISATEFPTIGRTWYCLKNVSGKVCKFDNFPTVDLSDFIHISK